MIFSNINKAVEESIDSKFAAIETERKLLKEAERVLRQNLHNSKEITDDNFHFSDLEPRKSTPTKFTYPLEEITSHNDQEEKHRLEQLKKEKEDILVVIARIKRQTSEIEMQEEELHREIELEKALINGEFKSKHLELEKLENKKLKLLKRAQRIEDSMRDCQMKQELDQQECRKKLLEAQDVMAKVEEKLKSTSKL